jgi:leader peptidase (prepilin peptidase)/N-methyltransferase
VELLIIILYSLSLGSFANVLIVRLPKNLSLLTSSSCPKCKTKIKIWHNIPILSFIFLKGKCNFCNQKISKRYPIIEFLSAIIGIILYFKFGYSIQTILLILTFILLLALSIIDIDYKAVPDSLNLFILTLIIIIPLDLISILENLKNALLFVGAFTLLRFYTSFFVGRESMGEADIIVAGMIGALLNPYFGAIAIFISSLISLPVHLIIKDRELPFIPFLASGLFLVTIFQDIILNYLI